MIKIYTHPALYQVVNIQNLLGIEQIKTTVRNEYASGGSGELAPQDVWPELWLSDDKDEAAAKVILDNIKLAEAQEWLCPQCDEKNTGAFDFCWQCEAPKSEV